MFWDRWFDSGERDEPRQEPTIGAASDFASTDVYPEWFRDTVVGPRTSSGKIVGPSAAMRQSAVFASVNLRCGTLAQCPFVLYRRVGKDKVAPDPKHPLYRILHDQPNRIQTSMDFVQMMQMHVDLRGNAYAKIIRDGAGRVTELWPMHPANVQVLQANDGTLFYDWTLRGKKQPRMAQREVMHLRSLADDMYMGMSRISMARERLGITAAAEEYSGKLLANDARPSVVLRHPKKIGDDAIKRLRDQWVDTYGGSSKAGKAAILEEGMEMQVMQMSNRDAQFLELMNFGVKDIARFFDVPGFLIGDDGKSATYASAVQAVLMFEKFTMSEIARNWELAVKRDLLREDEREKWFAEVNLQALQRGDFVARTEAYNRAVGGPWMVANEARKLENLPPMAGGETLNRPTNMTPADQPNPQPGNPPSKMEEPEDDEEENDE